MAAPARLARTLIRVSGPDARSFLQNVLTQNLDPLDAARVLYGALLSPQGKVIADMLLWAGEDGALVVDADPARGADVLRRLSMYKLRAQASIEDVSDQLSVVVSETPCESAEPDPRLPTLGWRKIVARAEAPDGDGAEWYDAQRLALGVPDLARDAEVEEVFGLEALLEELNGVDFQKGCFVGQENVSRMKRRATTRKKFCPIVFDGEPLPFGAPIRAGEAELGSVRTGVAGRAMALLRLDRALAAEALSVNGRTVRLDPPPWLLLPDAEA